MQDKSFIFDPLSSDIDRVWAGAADDKSNRFSNYYDYYFSGEDIKIFIDGLFDPNDELDVQSFAYAIRQEKQPLYGFWSYNYDAVMLGTRIISGEISIYTRHPHRMTDLLQKAAKNREKSAESRRDSLKNPANTIVSRLGPRNLNSEDEKNIRKYWAYSQLDRITYDKKIDSKNIFSAHPPFNFVIVYGAEETALSPFSAAFSEDVNIENNLDRMMYSDVNQRSIRADSVGAGMKTVLQQVNLMNMSVGYTPGGQAAVETYQFMARDFYHTSVDLRFVRDLVSDVVSDSDTNVGNDDTPTASSFNG